MKLLIGIPSLDFMHVDSVECLTALIQRLKDDKVDFYDGETGKFLTDDNGNKLVVTNSTKWMSLQFYVNYFFL